MSTSSRLPEESSQAASPSPTGRSGQAGRDLRTPEPRRDPAAALVFDDPLAMPSTDDTDSGWGERPSTGDGGAADLARFLDEKPPHHL